MHKTAYRTHTCGELKKSDVGKSVALCGWVMRRRDHGGLVFVDLRDRYGLTQIVITPESKLEKGVIHEIKPESVVKIEGVVRERPSGMINNKLPTGEIEIVAKIIYPLSLSKTPPFEIDSEKDVNEELRLEYRYLDLRRERMQKNIILRHKLVKFVRDFFDKKDFIEVETPVLIKGTPEGSREYVVPSRLYPGKFYVLPQSPQQLKQLLMVAGFDKYFQIVKCFRDEDQRGDRQPEFTQIDIEMSFVDVEDILAVNEELVVELLKKFAINKKITPVARLTWQEAMDKYGSDKPDSRFGMEIFDITDITAGSGFKVFSETKKSGGFVRGINISGGSKFSRKELDDLDAMAKTFGAGGLMYLVIEKEGIKSPVAKYLNEKELSEIVKIAGAKVGDCILVCAGNFKTVCEVLCNVRLTCATKLGLRDENTFAVCWITDFPMFEINKETGKFDSCHHPFTAPLDEDADLLKKEPLKALAKAYDLVINGVEIASGSIRIHDSKLQSTIFDILGITHEDAKNRFGHLLRAFEYGPPPHGGIAWGIDRFIMMICDEPNIREVIAFPKDQKARDLMTGAPSILPEQQVKEMHIKVVDK